MIRGGYLENAGEILGPADQRELRERLRGEHLGLEQRDYALVPVRADGPIGPELPIGDWRGKDERRHTWHPRRWQILGPGQQSRISRSSPEVFCTAYEAGHLASALQVAHDAGREERALEIRRALGVQEPRRW